MKPALENTTEYISVISAKWDLNKQKKNKCSRNKKTARDGGRDGCQYGRIQLKPADDEVQRRNERADVSSQHPARGQHHRSLEATLGNQTVSVATAEVLFRQWIPLPCPSLDVYLTRFSVSKFQLGSLLGC